MHHLLLVVWWLSVLATPPLAATWHVTTLHIAVSAPGCLYLVGNGRLDTLLPESCNVRTYRIGPGGDANYAPAGRTIVLVDAGVEVARIVVPRFACWMPLVAAPEE